MIESAKKFLNTVENSLSKVDKVAGLFKDGSDSSLTLKAQNKTDESIKSVNLTVTNKIDAGIKKGDLSNPTYKYEKEDYTEKNEWVDNNMPDKSKKVAEFLKKPNTKVPEFGFETKDIFKDGKETNERNPKGELAGKFDNKFFAEEIRTDQNNSSYNEMFNMMDRKFGNRISGAIVFKNCRITSTGSFDLQRESEEPLKTKLSLIFQEVNYFPTDIEG